MKMQSSTIQIPLEEQHLSNILFIIWIKYDLFGRHL